MSGAIDFTDPVTSFVMMLLIGIVAGVLFDRFAGPGWLSRQVIGATRGVVTSALVGVAGSFVGYHLARSSPARTHRWRFLLAPPRAPP
jgi:uncharacterized membrane protein YeaQ/YmgE (transglycosylase-associated protein family)